MNLKNMDPLFSTSGKCVANPSDRLTKNYIGACVENISKAMKTGAILEIELEPYVCQMDPEKYTLVDFDLNPFHGRINSARMTEALNTMSLEDVGDRPEILARPDWANCKRVVESYEPCELRDMYNVWMRETMELYNFECDICNSPDEFRLRLQREVNILSEAGQKKCNIWLPCSMREATTDEFFA
eukprot:gene26020-32544_t